MWDELKIKKDELFMSNDVSEFGKDLGLIHEALITGRKVGAGSAFFSVLAQNEDWFAKFAELGNHLAVLQQFKQELTIVSTEAAEELIKQVSTIVDGHGCGCITCDQRARRPVYHLFVPAEVLEKDKAKRAGLSDKKAEELLQHQEDSYPKYFFNNIIGDGLRKMGIHPAELARISKSGLCCNENGWVQAGGCTTVEGFATVLKRVILQRNVLHSMRQLN